MKKAAFKLTYLFPPSFFFTLAALLIYVANKLLTTLVTNQNSRTLIHLPLTSFHETKVRAKKNKRLRSNIRSTLSQLSIKIFHLFDIIEILKILYLGENPMDKQIKKVKKDVKTGNKPKALKDIDALLKMDKKFDEKVEKYEKLKKSKKK